MLQRSVDRDLELEERLSQGKKTEDIHTVSRDIEFRLCAIQS